MPTMNPNLSQEIIIMILIYLAQMIDFVMIRMEVQEENANQRNQEKIKNPENIEKQEKINYKISDLPEYLFYAKVIFTIISVFSDTS